MYHFVSPLGWVRVWEEQPSGLLGCRVVGVHVGRSCRRRIWQTVALLRSYVAKTKSAVPSSLVDTITFIIYGSL